MPSVTDSMTFDYEHFNHAHLKHVLPLGITRRSGNVAYTLMSLELYADGFTAVLTLEQSDPEHPGGPEPMPLLLRAMPAISAGDDRGNTYAGRPRAGAGGGSMRGSQLRMVHIFAPALATDANTLTLEIEWVERPGWNADGSPLWTADDLIADPLSLIFPLTSEITN